MLYLIGLGLGNEKDLTVNAVETLKKCDFIYLESYTSLIGFELKDLEKLIGKKITVVDRSFVEINEEIITNAQTKDVALLVKGDIFSATTHTDIINRARENKIQYRLMHNASVLTAIGDTGLSLYKFGKTISIPFDNEKIESAYNAFLENKNMHTLFLLDLRPSENRYMNFKEALSYLLNKKGKVTQETKAVICAGLGTEKETIKYGKIKELLKLNLEVYPQCVIIPGDMHFMEEEFLDYYKI
jgi:diphthine synthase